MRFQFERLADNENAENAEDGEDEVSGFDLGHISIYVDDDCVISSKYKNPSQALMIFATLGLYLDNLIAFVQSKKTRATLHAVDSSFDLSLHKTKSGVKISYKEEAVFADSVEDVFASFLQATIDFLAIHETALAQNGGHGSGAIDDLRASIAEARSLLL